MSLADISLSEIEPYEKSLILNSDVIDSASDKEE